MSWEEELKNYIDKDTVIMGIGSQLKSDDGVGIYITESIPKIGDYYVIAAGSTPEHWVVYIASKGYKKILIVDDDQGVRKTLLEILTKEGYSVDTADNGKTAIQKSETKFYNLALIDIRLPDMDGTKLLRKIKDTTPKMIKMIITGYPTLQNAIEATNMGADAYVLKPFKIETLLHKIKKHLTNQSKSKKFCEEKVVEFIETRAKELEMLSQKNA